MINWMIMVLLCGGYVKFFRQHAVTESIHLLLAVFFSNVGCLGKYLITGMVDGEKTGCVRKHHFHNKAILISPKITAYDYTGGRRKEWQ